MVKFIAEIGVNHNGNVNFAKYLIKEAKAAGCDVVKFQIYNTNKLIKENTALADYQKINQSDSTNQYEMLKNLELNHSQHLEIYNYCLSMKIDYLASVFDEESLDFICKTLNCESIKFGSGELSNLKLLWLAAKNKKHIILSTGMAPIGDIELALTSLALGYLNIEPKQLDHDQILSIFHNENTHTILKKYVTLMHCTSEYPSNAADANLSAIKILQNVFGLNVGFSDHTNGIACSLGAVSMGVKLIEKHFTSDKNLSGPDHLSSTEPKEFSNLILETKNLELALAKKYKSLSGPELKNRNIVRKKIIASKIIKKDDYFCFNSLSTIRSEEGLDAINLFSLMQKKASQDYFPGDIIFE
jgi:sialic acid synthase SpsE